MITENSMDEDYVADDQTADVGVDEPSSSPQKNISGKNTLTSSPKKSAAPTAPSHVASSATPNALPNLDTNSGLDGDLTPDPVVTLAIIRDDFQAAAALNAAPESLKNSLPIKLLLRLLTTFF
ncbi:hypothetical protein RhiirB3_451324 [Rhizophagus irregularis]|nr:hypothetical protein RhiirB3_451324 [Rhizophagus irregularis]